MLPTFYFCKKVKFRKSEAVGKYFWHLRAQKKHYRKFSLIRKNVKTLRFETIAECSLFSMQFRTAFRKNPVGCKAPMFSSRAGVDAT